MPSLVQRHQLRVQAERAAAASAANDVAPSSGPYALMMHSLVNDMRSLKTIQSLERKIAAKVGMIPAYDSYIEGVLAADAGGEDEVVTTIMVWLVDTLQLGPALRLAEHVIRHKMKLPERYNRNAATLLLDQVSDAVLAHKLAPTDDLVEQLSTLITLTADQDAPDQARAKLHRAIGEVLASLAGAEPTGMQLQMARGALQHLNRARSLHEGVGVKKTIEVLQRTIKNAEADA